MCTTTEKIQSIINERAKHLPVIQKQKAFLADLLSRIKKLDKLVAVINNELSQEQGAYYNMIADDSQIERAFRKVNSIRTKELIKEELKKLENLEKRFGRTTICIAMIGYERQGKSTFLQAISGLDNSVIPAYSGTSCTGAVSVIHNTAKEFRAEVEWYTHEEFLDIVREKLKKFFPNREYVITDVNDLRTIDLSGFQTNDVTVSTEYNKFVEAFCGHVDDYISMLNKTKMIIRDKNDVIKHVAQYEEFECPPDEQCEKIVKNDGSIVYKKNYYKYIAVKNINIYTPFNTIDSHLVQLVDTIGLGDSTNAQKIEEEMFRVLREDCDAAVNLFKPDSLGGGINSAQTNILTKISTKLAGRYPEKWIVYVINKVTSGIGANASNIPAVIKSAENALGNLPNKPVAWVKAIQGNNAEEVKTELVNPLLDLITKNLPEIDAVLMASARETSDKLFDEYATLVNNVERVLTSSMKHSGNTQHLFRELYKTLKSNFATALTKLNNEYKQEYFNPCREVADTLEAVIGNIYDCLPDNEKIAETIDMGTAIGTAYDIYCDEFCNRIYKEFESVSTDVIVPLREQVKQNIAKVLFNEGKMGKIRLTGYDIKEGPSIAWLQQLVEERVKADTYPSLHEALMFVLSYHFNIEDSIEDDVARSIGTIDKLNSREFVYLPQRRNPNISDADFIFQELFNRVPDIQSNLRKYKERFAMIPSRSFATRVNKFHIKLLRDENTVNDIEGFYIDNENAIWKEDFQNQVDAETAFGQWNEVSENLSELLHKDMFVL